MSIEEAEVRAAVLVAVSGLAAEGTAEARRAGVGTPDGDSVSDVGGTCGFDHRRERKRLEDGISRTFRSNHVGTAREGEVRCVRGAGTAADRERDAVVGEDARAAQIAG